MMGELSAARQALESAGLAPGDRTTLNSLRNLERRPVCLAGRSTLTKTFPVGICGVQGAEQHQGRPG